jgi:hypothetical protein
MNKLKKLEKKSESKSATRTKLVINFPDVFTVDDIQAQHPDAVNITLRFRINKAVEEGKVTAVAKIPRQIGRPALIYATTPVTQSKRDSAAQLGGIGFDEFEIRTTGQVNSAGSTPAATPVPEPVTVNSDSAVTVGV